VPFYPQGGEEGEASRDTEDADEGRGWCPSCGGQRMTELAAHLVDAVLPVGGSASMGVDGRCA
jgi:hypothetical protein